MVKYAQFVAQPNSSIDKQQDWSWTCSDLTTATPSLFEDSDDSSSDCSDKNAPRGAPRPMNTSDKKCDVTFTPVFPQSGVISDIATRNTIGKKCDLSFMPAFSESRVTSDIPTAASSFIDGGSIGPEPYKEPGKITDKGGTAAFPQAARASRNILEATRMIRNIPKWVTRDALMEVLKQEGYFGLFDFLYMPVLFSSGLNFGYAFINLVCPQAVEHFMVHFHGFKGWDISRVLTEAESEGADVMSTSVVQGLRANVERYRNSPVMHAKTPDEYRPVIFKEGARVPFPPPTRALRAPRPRS